MGIFSRDYSKPGPGISRDERKRKGLGRFYQIFIRKFWDLIKLNLLYIITLLPTFAIVFFLSGMISNQFGLDPAAVVKVADIPLVEAAKLSVTTDLLMRFYIAALFSILWGGGPATAGEVYILRSFLWEDPVFLVSDFFEHIKSNFRQALIVWIIDLIAFTLLCYGYFFYNSATGFIFYGKYVILVIGFFYTMLHMYLYHLMVTYKLKIGELYRNAALFSISALPFTVITILFVSFFVLIFPAIGFTAANDTLSIIFSTLALILLVSMTFSASGLYIEHNAITQIKKYIKEDSTVERNE